MSLIWRILLAVLGLVSVAHSVRPLPPNAALTSPQGLTRLFFGSRVAAQDPMVAMACFADYIADSNAVSENYSKTYNECLVEATTCRKQINEQVMVERKEIIAASMDVCDRMHTCNTLNLTLDLFRCHGGVGANNTKDIYLISSNASEYASTLEERYRLVDLQHEQCCHAAERAYVDQTAGNYNRLQACLDGRVQPRPPTTTTSSTSTTTTTTTTTTTEAPTTTPTEEPTTEPIQNIQDQFVQLLKLLN